VFTLKLTLLYGKKTWWQHTPGDGSAVSPPQKGLLVSFERRSWIINFQQKPRTGTLEQQVQRENTFRSLQSLFLPTYLKLDKVITQLNQVINNYNKWKETSSLEDFTKLIYDSYYRNQHMINWLEKRKHYPEDQSIAENIIRSKIELGSQNLALNKIGEVVQEMSTLTDQLDIDVKVGFLKILNQELNTKTNTLLNFVNSFKIDEIIKE